jgi:hypothetical protein
MTRTIAAATLVAGTLDLLFAMILTAWYGREVGGMLRYVGSGPFPAAVDMGTAGAALGLLTHFTLMAIMAAAYVLAARQWPILVDRPIQSGLVYAFITYVVMNLVVVPLRFGTPLPPKAVAIATQGFAHIFLVGLPIALIAARGLRAKAFT